MKATGSKKKWVLNLLPVCILAIATGLFVVGVKATINVNAGTEYRGDPKVVTQTQTEKGLKGK